MNMYMIVVLRVLDPISKPNSHHTSLVRDLAVLLQHSSRFGGGGV
jgi:hypothetical protein